MSKSILPLLFLFICFQTVRSQEVRYFTRHFQTMVPEKTENQRTYVIENKIARVEDRINGDLEKKITVYGFADIAQLNEFIWYGGSYASEINYRGYFRYLKGEFEYYDKAGNLERQYLVKDARCTFSQVWDENQTPLLVKGTGRQTVFSAEMNEDMTTVFQDSLKVLSYGVRIEQKDTIYYTFDKMALPKEGIQSFYTQLVKKLKYPVGARISGKEARIYIQFIVDETGKLTEFKALSSEGYRFEQKTLRKLEAFPSWDPAVYHGRKVKAKYVLPVKFELD